nr:retrovirus-related Pol polyprotein from transposon TNT 1-94 [Tanacetum cinerariifolium]
MPLKPDLVFNNAPNDVETNHPAFNVKLSPTKPDQHMSHTHRHSEPIIEDWVSDSEDKSETKTPQNIPSFVQPTEQVKSLRPSVQHIETSISAATHKPSSLKPTSNGKHRNRKACFVCKSLDHLIKDCDYHEKKMAQPTGCLGKMGIETKMPNFRPWFPQHKCIHDPKKGNPQHALKDKRVIDSGCSRHMTGNMSYLFDFEELNDGYIAFGSNPNGGMISGKGKIRTGKLDFNDVYFVKELKFNLFSVSQMCEKKNSVLFTDTECLVLSPEFKLPDENQVLLRVPRENNMYNVDLKNIVPFGDLTLTILNTLDSLGKFDRKVDKGFLVGYSISSKSFRVFNSRTRIVQETLNVNFLENKPNVIGSGPTWLFDIDTITNAMNYQPVTACNQSNPSACIQEKFDAQKAREEMFQQYVLFPVWSSSFTNPQNTDGDSAFDEKEPEFDEKKHESEVNVSPSSSAQSKKHDDKTKRKAKGKSPIESFTGYINLSAEFEDFSDNSINEVNAAGTLVPTVWQISPNNTNTFSATGPSNVAASQTHGKYSCIDTSQLPDDPDMPELEDITYSNDEDDVGAEVDFNNLETSITVSPIPTSRVHKDHPVTQIIGDLSLATQTRSMTRVAKDQEPKRVHQALKDPSWIEAMQEELLQFKMHKVWVLVDLPHGKRAIGTKWVFKNKKDKRGIMVRNKARLVAQGHTQEEGIDYEEVIASVARIEAIRLFLAYASFMEFMVYQMDVKSAFLYETIKEELYVCQPPGFEDPNYPDKVYKVVKGLYGLHQALRAWLHIDLFGPTFVKSLSKKSYCLVITDDYSIFSWVFFLASKDETPHVLKTFIISLENLLSLKVKIIRCDNETEFKNADLNQFCGLKGIKREFSIPRTPQQNGITERKNRTLIEAARTLLADLLLPIPFWAEAVNTACYVQNSVLVTKPHNKTPYELLHGRLPSIGFMRPFGCPVTILNTLDPLGKFQGKVDEGFLIGYSVCSKAFRVFNSRTRIVQETLHVNFMENKPNVAGEEGTQTYVLFLVLSDGSITSQNNNKDALFDEKEHDDDIQKFVSPDIHSSSSGAQTRKQGDKTKNKDKGKSPVVTITGFRDLNAEFEECNNNSSNGVNAASSLVFTARQNSINSTNDFSAAGPSNAAMPNLEDLSYSNNVDDVGAEANINNMESIILVSPIPTTRIHKDHPSSQIIGDLSSTSQTRSMARVVKDQVKQVNDVTRLQALVDKKRVVVTEAAIREFWTSVAVKKVNDVRRLQALVDKKEVIIMEATIREALRLDDAEGVECFPNEEIFAELAIMGYEKPSTKITFYKAFFSSQKQVGDLSTHTTKYTSPALTQKVFANMRMVGKGFFGVETLLFKGMIVEQQVAKGADEVHDEGIPTASIVAEGDVSAVNDETKEQIEEENRALQKNNETPAERATKRRKLDKEVEDLKRHLDIMADEDDDVYTEATPLARKVPVVDYEISELNKKPYYKIIREESKNCTWSSKGQELEATGIMWCADHNVYNYSVDFVSGEETKLRMLMSSAAVETRIKK